MTAPAERLDKLPLGPRLRLVTAILVGVLAFIFIPDAEGLGRRSLLAWDTAVAAFIVLILMMMGVSTTHHMRRRAAMQDQGRSVILTAIVAGALFSLVGLAFVQKEMKATQSGGAAADLALIVATIMLSWALVHLVFTLHYAHAYYGPAEDENDEDGLVGGLEFPGEKKPDYWDFAYFSFVIGMTCQVSDVGVSGRDLRRLALLHGIVSFFFNTIILALTINILASSL